MEVQRLLPPWQRIRELCRREQDLTQHHVPLYDPISDNIPSFCLALSQLGHPRSPIRSFSAINIVRWEDVWGIPAEEV